MNCACGCGGEIPPRKKGSRKGVRYLIGHHTRVTKRPYAVYTPTPEEIPSGLCECGCGGKTTISKTTCRSRRHFRGHPMPYVTGHSKKGRARGADHGGPWKGGRIVTDQGYAKVRTPLGHPYKGPYINEHRIVMESILGRYLESFEQVHHINGVKTDNRPENLELWTRSQPAGIRHADYHCPGCRCHEAKRKLTSKLRP